MANINQFSEAHIIFSFVSTVDILYLIQVQTYFWALYHNSSIQRSLLTSR